MLCLQRLLVATFDTRYSGVKQVLQLSLKIKERAHQRAAAAAAATDAVYAVRWPANGARFRPSRVSCQT